MGKMTLEYLELMEMTRQRAAAAEQAAQQRRRLAKSFRANARIYDDGSIEVDPQAQGVPAQRDVKKVGRSKRYSTTGRSPLTCVELKCPEGVTDKVAFFQRELAKLTRDMAIEEPALPAGEFLLNERNVKVRFAAQSGEVMAWLTFEVKGLLEIRRELYALTSEIDKCFVVNSDLICPQR